MCRRVIAHTRVQDHHELDVVEHTSLSHNHPNKVATLVFYLFLSMVGSASPLPSLQEIKMDLRPDKITLQIMLGLLVILKINSSFARPRAWKRCFFEIEFSD